MTEFTFKAYGSILTQKAEDVLEAMQEANIELLWGNPEYKDGMWVEQVYNTYVW